MRKGWLIIFPVNSNAQKLIAVWQAEIYKLGEFNSANPHFKLQGGEYKYDHLTKGMDPASAEAGRSFCH